MTDTPQTNQREAVDPPFQEERYVSVMLRCVTCDTFRVFRAEAALMHVLDRHTQHIAISTCCEQCHTEVEVSVFWGKGPLSYLYTRPALSKAVQGVKDSCGLRRPNG
jgi:hypothetical protein